MLKLSVIVPVYKVEEYLPKCVESILNQSMKDFELILVDDGSPDNCGALCDAYAVKDKRVKVLHQVNAGLSAARNAGLDTAKGEYIGFIDSDDWIEQGLFEDALRFCDEQNLDVVFFETYIVKGETKRACSHFDEVRRVFSGSEALAHILIEKIDNAAWNKFYRRGLWQQLRFPHGRLFEEIATIYKTFIGADKVGYLRRPYYNYVRRGGSIMASSFDARKRYQRFLGYKERYLFSAEHCPKVQNDCAVFAVRAANSVLSAVCVDKSLISPEQEAEVLNFIREHRKVSGSDFKSRILAWGACHCRALNKIYGHLSLLSKKAKG